MEKCTLPYCFLWKNSKIYSVADTLVDFVNCLSEFKPSKTFGYIVSGKFIIHIILARKMIYLKIII